MSTSLAEQLERLRVPQTSNLKQDKKKPSLLFDPKEAASFRKETIYQLGLNGLEDLISKNPKFADFKSTIFNSTSIEFERSMHDAESNRNLDRNIRRFFILLSPYFLTNPAHKALEWLIRRYSIHEYNREDLIMLALPYHESNIFVRVIQLMKFKDRNDSWFFLKTIQKPGVHLPKNALINHAMNNEYFLKFLTKFLKYMIKEHKSTSLVVAFNFYACVFIGVIEYCTEITDAHISQILPSLLQGFKSEIPDYCSASLLIVARLLAKSTLTDVVLDKFVCKISQIGGKGLKVEAIMTLVLIYQFQKQYKKMPQEACLNLIRRLWLGPILQDLNNSGSYVYPFIELIIKSYVEIVVEDEKFLAENRGIENILNAVKFDENSLGSLLCAILDVFSPDSPPSVKIQNWLTKITEILERQYPESFDKQIQRIFSLSLESQLALNRKENLKNILKNAMSLKGKFDVFCQLYHPNPKIRTQAVKFVSKNFKSLRPTELEMIKRSLIERLNDDNISVIKESLKVIKQLDVLNRESFKRSLINLFNKCQNRNFFNKQISFEIVSMLCSKFDGNDWEIFVILLTYILMNPKLDNLKLILNSKFAKNNKLLKQIKMCDDFDKMKKIIFDSTENRSDLSVVEEFVKSLRSIENDTEKSIFSKFITIKILSWIVPKKCEISETVVSLIDLVENYFESCRNNFCCDNFDDKIEIARRESFPLEEFYVDFGRILQKIEQPSKKYQLSSIDLTESNDLNKFFYLTVKVLISGVNPEKRLNYIKKLAPNSKLKTQILLNLTLSGKLSEQNQIESLKCVSYLLKDPIFIKINQNDNGIKLISTHLLILLGHKSNEVRVLALEAMRKIKCDLFAEIFKDVNKQQEEILMDHEQIPLIVYNLFTLDSKIYENVKKFLIDLLIDSSTPIYVKSGVLVLISHLNSIEIFEKCAKTAVEILKKNRIELNRFQSEIILKNISRFEESISSEIIETSIIFNFFQLCLKSDDIEMILEGKSRSPASLLLEQINKEFFANLNSEVESKFLDAIIELATVSQNSDVFPAANKIFKHIDLNANAILDLLKQMRDIQSTKQNMKKKRRLSVIPTVDILDMIAWKKGTTILEFIQNKKKIRNSIGLISILFGILKKCLDFDEQAAVEYPKQLILSTLYNFCSKLSENDLTPTVFNIELIVQCIRASPNPQTHHHALLVLTCAVEVVPTEVLHHIMAIFTFMGSSVLRQDDVYSFQIISKIIDNIIPILIRDGKLETIGGVLRVFVDAILDIPEHRRLTLFEHLLNKMDAYVNLHIFLLLTFESHVVHGNQTKNVNAKNSGFGQNADYMKRLDVAANLVQKFPANVILHSFVQLLEYLRDLPDDKPEKIDSPEKLSNSVTFNVAFYTPKQFRHYKYTLITFIGNFLISKDFIHQIANLKQDAILNLEVSFKNLIVSVLTYIQRVSKVAERNLDTPQSQYWKVILHHSHDVLDGTNALLTPQMFLLVMKGLTAHNLSTIKRRALELLNSKLQYNVNYFNDCDKADLYSLVPTLLSIIQAIESNSLESEQEIIIQTALLSLKLLIKLLCQDYPDKFVEILSFVADVMKCESAQNNVLASVVLCVAELCVNLKAKAIPALPEFMPTIIKILRTQKNSDTPNILMVTCVTTIQKIFDVLPHFLSPYLEKLLYELCSINTNLNSLASDDPKYQTILNKLSNIEEKIGSIIPTRVLVPVIEKCFNKFIEKDFHQGVGPLLRTLAYNISNLNCSDLVSNQSDLTNFFLNALQFRSEHKSTNDVANYIEGHVVEALCALILKLSESSFRPLFYKLYDWAVRNEAKSEKLITYYHLTSTLAKNLKALFVYFCGHFLGNAAAILDYCNVVKSDDLYFGADTVKNVMLLENILTTLMTVFSFVAHKFINRERFELVMQPIVDQLENNLGGYDALMKRSEELVVPCIVNFVVATGDDALWKQLNYQVLLKMRHGEARVRLIALNCLTQVVKRLGEDFLPLLPETIPFLAELLEDEEENVEKACQKAIQEMEKILGEPLQKYF